MEIDNKDAYMVFGYACNQKCMCCPCQKDLNLKPIIELKELKNQVDKMKTSGITDVTISGGEPTIYPDFFEIIKYLIDNNLKIHILSNGEKFSDISFATKFVELAKSNRITVTTTFHSYAREEHERQNGSNGSFDRSIKGLKFLDDNNIRISVKHCITKYNYKDLKKFIEFVTSTFSPKAELQIWGIDLCGIDRQTADKYFVDFKTVKPYIEETLDYFEAININNRNQILTINNLPLCMCDCYYWNYFTIPNSYYINYLESSNKEFEINYGAISSNCNDCPFRQYCKGAYKTIFEVYGDSIVECPQKEKQINEYKSRYVIYNKENLDKLYFSIYDEFYLTPKGFTIYNRKTKIDVNIRLKTKEIIELINVLDKGIEKSKLKKIFNNFTNRLNADEIINEWIIKGIIE